jgi:hypothetical protein
MFAEVYNNTGIGKAHGIARFLLAAITMQALKKA